MRKISVLLALVILVTLTSLSASTIHLVWQTDRLNSWEEDWLMECLSGLDVTVVDDANYKKYLDNSVIVLSAWKLKGSKEYFKKLKKLGYRFGVILLGDERYLASPDFYKYPKFVLRNYWHKNFQHQNHVIPFPLGYKVGFWSDCQPSRALSPQRDFTWSFAGQIANKPTREAMVSAMKVFPQYYIHEIHAWADSNSLNTSQYRDLLLNTLFVPCPSGWCNLDSYRVYEALECGCIPIVEKFPQDYFSNFFGNHPFIAVDSWDQAPAQIAPLLADPILLEQRRLQCYQWWQTKKKEFNQRFVYTIQTAFQSRK